MAKRVGVDKWLFGVVLLLVLFGLVMVFSASAVMAKETLGSPYSYVGRQAIWALLGMLALTVLMRVDYRLYNNPRVVFPAVAITMLLLIGVFAMSGMNGAHRWIRLAGTTLQPSEFAKPVIVLFLAYFLQTRIHQMDDWKGTILRAAAVPLAFSALILKEPDLGTAMVCMAVTALMLYLAGARARYFAIGAALASPVMYYMLFHVKFRRDRMLAFVNPEADPRGTGFHILQSLIAGWDGRDSRAWIDGGAAEAVLSTRGADGLHLREYMRGVGADWGGDYCRAVCGSGVSRAAGGVSVDRSVCEVPGVWADDGDPDPGLLQYERGAGAAADEGDSAAVHLVGWDVDFSDAGRHGRAAECDA